MLVWIADPGGYLRVGTEHSFVSGAKPAVNEPAARSETGFRTFENVEISERFVFQIQQSGLELGYHLDPSQGPAGCNPWGSFSTPLGLRPTLFRSLFEQQTLRTHCATKLLLLDL
jgi:hypothetical protein